MELRRTWQSLKPWQKIGLVVFILIFLTVIGLVLVGKVKSFMFERGIPCGSSTSFGDDFDVDCDCDGIKIKKCPNTPIIFYCEGAQIKCFGKVKSKYATLPDGQKILTNRTIEDCWTLPPDIASRFSHCVSEFKESKIIKKGKLTALAKEKESRLRLLKIDAPAFIKIKQGDKRVQWITLTNDGSVYSSGQFTLRLIPYNADESKIKAEIISDHTLSIPADYWAEIPITVEAAYDAPLTQNGELNPSYQAEAVCDGKVYADTLFMIEVVA